MKITRLKIFEQSTLQLGFGRFYRYIISNGNPSLRTKLVTNIFRNHDF